MMRVKLPLCLGGADLAFSLKRIPGKRDQAAFVRHISAKVDILAIRLKRRGIKLGSSEKMRESILRDLEHFESECIAEGKLFDFHEDLIPEVGSIAETLEWAADTIDLDLNDIGAVRDLELRQGLHRRSEANRAKAEVLRGNWGPFRQLKERLHSERAAEAATKAVERLSALPEAVTPVAPEVPAYTVQEAVMAFLGEKEAGKLAPKTMSEYRTWYPELAQRIGPDRNLCDVTRDDLLAWRDKYLTGAASQATMNKQLGKVGAFFTWAYETQRGRLPVHYHNPAVRLHPQIGKSEKVADHEQRERWSDEELLVIPKKAEEADYTTKWMIRIGVYTGARLNEVAQLHKDDIQITEDGIVALRIDDKHPDQRLKTRAARRVIPLGFPEAMLRAFMKEVETNGDPERVFPRLTFREAEESYSNSAGKLVNAKFLKSISKSKSYHGLRHSFMDRCKQREVYEAMIKEVVGHEIDDITSGRYGKRYGVKVLRDAITKAGVWDFFPDA